MPRPGRDGYVGKKIQSTRRSDGRIDPNLEAFGQIGANHFQLYLYDEDWRVEGPDGPQLITDELGPTVRLVIVRKLSLDLTNMTHEELTALRTFINRACDIAEPVVLARDKEAQDAYQSGDDTVARLHRAVPNVVVRQRAERAHREVLRLGPVAVLARGWDYINRLVRAGGQGEQVADGQPSDHERQDDGSSSD